ncbi:hypothetical protein ESZ53_10015 [Salinibacterium sp. UTAS2018]|nr:hypothetical protein ESZ53_10015 [Salinibacterium sp. UTAS2018]
MIIGIGTGVLWCDARTPLYRALPTLVALTLGMVATMLLVAATNGGPSLSYGFLGGLIVTQVAYTPWLWSKVFPEAGFTYWQLAVRQFTHPRALRREYSMLLGDDNAHPAR